MSMYKDSIDDSTDREIKQNENMLESSPVLHLRIRIHEYNGNLLTSTIRQILLECLITHQILKFKWTKTNVTINIIFDILNTSNENQRLDIFKLIFQLLVKIGALYSLTASRNWTIYLKATETWMIFRAFRFQDPQTFPMAVWWASLITCPMEMVISFFKMCNNLCNIMSLNESNWGCFSSKLICYLCNLYIHNGTYHCHVE